MWMVDLGRAVAALVEAVFLEDLEQSSKSVVDGGALDRDEASEHA